MITLSKPISRKATSFATLKDLKGYIQCLLKGGSESHCYSYGDNGEGAWGENTAQLDVPMCAVSPSDMIAQWGSVSVAHGKKILVIFPFAGLLRSVVCQVGDKAPDGVVDLNPAALQEANIPSDTELSVQATYYWLL